jgi:hypothetical protein
MRLLSTLRAQLGSQDDYGISFNLYQPTKTEISRVHDKLLRSVPAPVLTEATHTLGCETFERVQIYIGNSYTLGAV